MTQHRIHDPGAEVGFMLFDIDETHEPHEGYRVHLTKKMQLTLSDGARIECDLSDDEVTRLRRALGAPE